MGEFITTIPERIPKIRQQIPNINDLKIGSESCDPNLSVLVAWSQSYDFGIGVVVA
jgi:hypothetical protein